MSSQTWSFIQKASNSIQSAMPHGKPYWELLNEKQLSDHFLTPKIFKSMKFVSHCTSVLERFPCNFKGIISTFEKMETSETISLQECILNLDFVLDYLMVTDIMSHLTFFIKI